MVREEVKLTSQHQISIPKRIRQTLHLEAGDRLELIVMDAHRLLLKPKKLIDADDAAYQLGRKILEGERQIKRGEVTPWTEIKKRQRL